MYIYIYWYICNIYPSMKKRTRRLHFFCPFWFPIGGLTHWISSKTMLKQIQPIRVSRLQIAASSMKQCSASSCSRPPQKIWILWQKVWINGRAPQWFKWWKLTRRRYIHGISHSWDAKWFAKHPRLSTYLTYPYITWHIYQGQKHGRRTVKIPWKIQNYLSLLYSTRNQGAWLFPTPVYWKVWSGQLDYWGHSVFTKTWRPQVIGTVIHHSCGHLF